MQHKYGLDDAWVDTLTTQQVEYGHISILECSTYDALKAQLTDRNAK